MALNEKIITMDINTQFYKLLSVKNGDNDGARSLIIKLVNNNKPFDLEGLEVQVGAIKPDNTVAVNPCKILNAKDGRIELAFTTQMLAIAGILNMELNIIKERVRLSTIPFKVTVVPSIGAYGELVSSNEFEVLADAMGAVEKIKQQQLQGYYSGSISIINAYVCPEYFRAGDTIDNASITVATTVSPYKIYLNGEIIKVWTIRATNVISFRIPYSLRDSKEFQVRVEDVLGNMAFVNLGIHCCEPFYVCAIDIDKENPKYDAEFIESMENSFWGMYQPGFRVIDRIKVNNSCVFYAAPEKFENEFYNGEFNVRVLSFPVDTSKEIGQWVKVASGIPFISSNGYSAPYAIYKSKNDKCTGKIIVDNKTVLINCNRR